MAWDSRLPSRPLTHSCLSFRSQLRGPLLQEGLSDPQPGSSGPFVLPQPPGVPRLSPVCSGHHCLGMDLTPSLDSESCEGRTPGLSWSLLCSQQSAQDGAWRGAKYAMSEEGSGGLADRQGCSLSLAGAEELGEVPLERGSLIGHICAGALQLSWPPSPQAATVSLSSDPEPPRAEPGPMPFCGPGSGWTHGSGAGAKLRRVRSGCGGFR